MGTSIVDGAVESAEVKRTAGKVVVYREIRFALDDGSKRTIKGAVAKRAVADLLEPGNRGRFYLFTGFDLKGVHGARLADGRSASDFPANNRIIFLIVMVMNLLWIALRVTVEGDVPLLGVGLFILGAVGFVLLGKVEREAKALFDGDNGPPPAQPAPAAG